MQDSELLQRYSTSSDEVAFGELVTRYLDLVHGVARRCTGDGMVAEEVAQNTFAILARKAAPLSRRDSLGGWLIKTARLEAKKALRSEYRRRRKHDALANEPDDHAMDKAEEAAWAAALPHLDEALEQLSGRDREVIVKRFYRNLKYREIAAATSDSTDGVRKQVTRALDRLSSILRSKGTVVPVGVIATALGAELTKAAPGTTASSIASGALTAAPQVATTTLLTNTLLTMANSKQIAAAAALVIAAGTAGFQWHTHSKLAPEAAAIEAKFIAAEKASSSSGVSEPITPKVAAMSDEVQWNDLIDLFEKMRFGRDPTYRLFIKKIELLDAQRQFTGADLAGALDELEAAGASARMVKEVGTTLVMFTDARDPAGCADAILQDDRIEFWRLGAALEEFGIQDPDAALKWYEERKESGALDPKGSRDAGNAEGALGSLIAGIAQTDLDAAVGLLATVPDESAKRGIYRLAFVISEPERRVAFIRALDTQPQLQTHSISAYAQAQIESESPAAAWAFLNELAVERTAEEKSAVMVKALDAESQRDMNQAPAIAQWIADNRGLLPNDGSVDETLGRTLNQWKIRDTSRAAEFEAAHPELFDQ